MSRARRHFTAQQKAEVVRRHLGEKVHVSDLAEELDVQPTLIHLWVKHVLDHAAAAFERSPGNRRTEDANERRITHLEEKLAK